MASKKINELVTGEDNSTLEPAYVWWAVVVLTAVVLQIYSVLFKATFDIQSYGIGIGALMAGAGWSKKIGS